MERKNPVRINNKYITIIITAVCLVIAAVIFSNAFYSDGEQSFYYSKKLNAAVVFSDENLQKNIVPGKSISGIRSNKSGLYSAVLMSEGSSYSLYSVSGSVVKQIDADCSNSFVTSFGAERTMYLTTAGNLYTDDGKMIDENVKDFAVSPGGKIVLYTKNQDDTEKLYLYSEETSVFVADNFFPLGVSDDSRYLYVLGADNSLCILNPDGSMMSKLCSDVNNGKFWFSDDMKNIVFSDSQYTYISQQGRSRNRLVMGCAVPVLSDETEYVANSYGNAYICKDADMYELFYSVLNDDGNYAVYYIKNDTEKTCVSENIKTFTVTGNRSVAYIDSSGRLCRFHNDKNEQLISGVKEIVATKDNRYIYYTNSAHELFVIKGKKTQQISENAEKIYVTSNNKLLFITGNKELYRVSGKMSAKLIDTDVNSCKCRKNAVFYSKNFSSETGTFDLYCSKNGNRFRFATDELTK